MAVHRIEVHALSPNDDPAARVALARIRETGAQVHGVRAARVFLLEGEGEQPSFKAVQRIAEQLLTDPVTERYVVGYEAPGAGRLIEIHYKPGVMDPVAQSTRAAIADMLEATGDAESPGIDVRTGRRYVLSGHLTIDAARQAARQALANESIETIHTEPFLPKTFPAGKPYQYKLVHVAMRDLDDDRLRRLSREGHLFLDLAEMRAIRDYFRGLQRDPTDAELETLAQSWSEHCVHKTLKARVEFTHDGAMPGGAAADVHVFDNLIKSTVFRATMELDLPWTLSVFKDNAGVIAFDADHAVCMKVETHNRPSAIEPYGGAATGIGGCIRDVMGTGLGARPFASTDIFCFADPRTPTDQVPAGALHPRRTARRVVAGVRDYGNRMGIPTVNGAVYFHPRYVGNPLVFCGTAGILPLRFAQKGRPEVGDRIVLVGGRTGRDGIHGATFSSDVVAAGHAREFSHAVQIGNAITEKKVLDVLLRARDAEGGPLYRAITDCGAGGLSSAVGEMGEETGASVALDRVPLKYDGLRYDEIWISEAQERMVLAVPPDHVEQLLELCRSEDVEATDLGVFDGSGRLSLYYQEQLVGQLDMRFIHDGLPRPVRAAHWRPPALEEPLLGPPANYGETLHRLLAMPSIASKHWIIRQYDHEVQAGTVIKPLVGATADGPGDAAVMRPVAGSPRGVVLSVGCQPRFGDIDPYQMALNGIDEAIRNSICVGGSLRQMALLDNFCWPKCADPLHMGALVRACQACYDGAKAFGTPFISGKDSLSNEFVGQAGETIRIPYTLLISAMSVIGDVSRCVTMDAKEAGDYLVIVGLTRRELGGSHYYALHENLGARVPVVDLDQAPGVHRAVEAAIAMGAVRAAHDLSEGGLAVALAEMLFAGGLGASIDLSKVPCGENAAVDDALLFSESATRYLLEVPPRHFGALSQCLGSIRFGVLGSLAETQRLKIRSVTGGLLMDESVEALKDSWQKPLDW